MRLSLRLKTILGVATIEAVLLLILTTSVLNYMQQSSEEKLQDYTTSMARLFATTTKDAIISFDLASLESYVDELINNEGILFVLIRDPNEQLLAEKFRPGFSLENINDNTAPDIYRALSQVEESGTLYGQIEIGVSTESIALEVAKARRMSFSIAAVEMILVALFSFALGLYLTRQLKYLHLGAKHIAAGNLEHKVEINTQDEVAEVAESFNQMIDALKVSDTAKLKYQKELEELNANLEQRVKQRTEQLLEKNQELEEAYHNLEQAQRELLQSKKMASLGQMAAGVAHEINTPIGFIKSNMSTLRRYIDAYKDMLKHYKHYERHSLTGSVDERSAGIKQLGQLYKKNDLDYIDDDIDDLLIESIEGVERISTITSGLQSFSHIERPAKEFIDLNLCLTEMLRAFGDQHQATVKEQYGNIPSLYCDKEKFCQAINNILNNSAQLELDPLHIKISTTATEENIVISILDNGPGIKKENEDKIFDPFFTTKPVGQGTGLGLSIAHGTIKDHGGDISVKNRDSESSDNTSVYSGAEFIIYLPTTPP